MRLPAPIPVAAVLATAFTAGAWAQVKPEDAIEYRKSVFTVVKWDFGPMAAMVKGKIPFDAMQFSAHANRVANMAPRALEGFIPGTDEGDTRAKPEIWTDWDTFESRMQTFVDHSAKLAALAGEGDEAAIKKQFGETGKACKACHDDFRED